MKNILFKLMSLSILLSTFIVGYNKVKADVTKVSGSTELVVTNPKVSIKKSENTIWAKVDVSISTSIPDNITVNQGDTMVFDIPKELTLETNYTFPVYNSTGNSIVAYANVNASTNKVTLTFNNYFTSHPANKSVSLKLYTKINRQIVKENTKYNISFNGTILELDTGSKGKENTNEVLYKYGTQDKNDPSIMNWTVRINYKKLTMQNVRILDTWSDNQEYVQNSLKYYYINSVNPWQYDSPATQALANTKFNTNGFSTNIDLIDKKILIIQYQTKLKYSSKSTTNKIEVSWEGGQASRNYILKLAGGSGQADGTTPPQTEIPNDPPVVDKPKGKGGAVPPTPPTTKKPPISITETSKKPKENKKTQLKQVGSKLKQLPSTGESTGAYLVFIGVTIIAIKVFDIYDKNNKKRK